MEVLRRFISEHHMSVALATNIVDFVRLVAHMGMSKNSVPLNPMVNDHYPY